LRTLGAVYLALDDGSPLGGAASQKRALALLAVLAVSGESGLSRDRLVALLWPESNEERARHSLTQLLYAARRAVNVDDLFLPEADVRLNPERITSDVRELDEALAAGELEAAVALHQGPFLDGFFLSGSAPFEQWVESQRTRIAERVGDALEQLGNAAESAGEPRRVVEWRRKLAAMRPLDAHAAVLLMNALAAAGDRAGALQHATLHATMLREELGLDPDPVVAELAEKLREPVLWTPATPDKAMPAVDEAPATASSTEIGTPANRDVPATMPAAGSAPLMGGAIGVWKAPRRMRYRWLPGATILALAIVAVLAASWWQNRRTSVGALAVHQDVVVAPFRVTGANASLRYLREGMVELLSTRLADDTVARSVDAGAVLAAWRTAGLLSATDVPRDTVVSLARQLGASRVVLGSVVGAPSRVIISASVVVAKTGAVSAQASVEGPADSLTTLVDRLAARLLVSEAGDSERLADQTTTSLPALRAYLDGQSAYVRRDYTSALRSYARALQGDSAFALAALHLAIVSERLGDHDGMRHAVARAWPFRSALAERDLAQLVAFGGPRYPAPSTDSELVEAWRRVVGVAPNRGEGWLELGARLFHDGAAAGVAAPDTEVRAALRRALALHADTAAAQRYLFQLESRSGSSALPSALIMREARFSARRPFAPFIRWHVAETRGDTAAQREMRDTLWRLGRANLRAIVQASQFDAIGVKDGETASRILLQRVGGEADRRDALMAAHSLASNRGRPRAARAVADQMANLGADARAPLRLHVLDALYAQGDTVSAAEAAAQLARASSSVVGEGVSSAAADECVLAQWRLARDDTTGVAETIASLRAPATATQGDGAGPAAACAALLDAWLAVATRRPDARARLDRTSVLAFTPVSAGQVSAYAPLLLARLFEVFGQRRRALEVLRRRPYMAGWPAYLATAWVEEGRLAEAMADSVSARRAYSRYLALHDEPEPEMAPRVDSVRRRLEILR
jgi:DNA-binding SARP family transcriptional activator/TolB-like protein